MTALKRDLDNQARWTADQTVTSIYFGGGTPSLLPVPAMETLLTHIQTVWTGAKEIEVTLEANPEDVTPEQLRAWRDVGVNRISLGIQALDDDALTFLGRAHTRTDALKAADLALEIFDNVSIDLIYARPGQSIEDWLGELTKALAIGAPHLSLYELTIKEKTAFQKQVERKAFTPLDDDAQADLYRETLRVTDEAGLPAYEVSNHARSDAYWSRHNLTYWLGGDWLGVGPGAEGRFTASDGRHHTRGMERPADYIEALDNGQSGLTEHTALTREEDADERLIMGLRSILGVRRGDLESLYGQRLSDNNIKSFRDSGHLQESDGRLKLTQEGWLIADYIAGRLSPPV